MESSELFWEVGILSPLFSTGGKWKLKSGHTEPKAMKPINDLTKIPGPVCLSPKSLPFPFIEDLLRRFHHAKEKHETKIENILSTASIIVNLWCHLGQFIPLF